MCRQGGLEFVVEAFDPCLLLFLTVCFHSQPLSRASRVVWHQMTQMELSCDVDMAAGHVIASGIQCVWQSTCSCPNPPACCWSCEVGFKRLLGFDVSPR